jgi:hypothetical protein
MQDVVEVRTAAPRGRKGLWDALARAAAADTASTTRFPTEAALAIDPDVPFEPECSMGPVLELADERAHLRYLARLAASYEGEATTVQVAPVVSLDEFRSRRH